MPTLMLVRRPASVTSPGVDCTSSSCVGGDVDVLALPVQLVRAGRRGPWSKASSQISTMPGWATQEPSKPSPASRVLSSGTFWKAASLTSGSLLGMNAAMPPIAWAPRLWQVRTSSSV